LLEYPGGITFFHGGRGGPSSPVSFDPSSEREVGGITSLLCERLEHLPTKTRPVVPLMMVDVRWRDKADLPIINNRKPARKAATVELFIVLLLVHLSP
jgi:hypothetical protein